METKQTAEPMTNKQAAMFLAWMAGALAFVGFVIWFFVVLTHVSNSTNPEAEMAQRPVFRAAFNAFAYVREIARPSFMPEREFVMPNGAKKLPDGTWSAPTKPWPAPTSTESSGGENSP